MNPKEQLDNVNKIKIVEYKYRKEFTDRLPEEQQNALKNATQTGVIAQHVQQILPDAVSRSQNNVKLANGRELQNMLIVNKDRLFLGTL